MQYLLETHFPSADQGSRKNANSRNGSLSRRATARLYTLSKEKLMAKIRRIETPQELEELIERSKQGPVWVFKHSLTCPISAYAWAEFQSFVNDRPEDSGLYSLIEVQTARPVSNAVAERTGVVHQSPQALLLRDAKVVWHASHHTIRVRALEAA
jgi:bacillithiol system protein YtxJ